MHFLPKKLYSLAAVCCVCAICSTSCRSAAFNAAVQGDAVTMRQLVAEGACLKEKNAMSIPKNPLYQLLVKLPVGLTAMAWDIGTLGNFFTGFSFAERVIMKKPNDWDDTPINAACLRGHADVVRIMLRAGERPDNFTIYQTARKNHVAVIQEFINAGIIGPNWEYDDWSLLMWSARDKATNVTKLLIDRGAYVNFTDDDGRTPLFLAAWNQNTLDANLLIAAGADINTVLNLTNNKNDADKSIAVVKTLVQAGAPASVFYTHYLYGSNSSTLGIAITNAGKNAEPPKPAPKVAPAPPKPRKAANPRPARVYKPVKKAPEKKNATTPKKPSSSSILNDFM